MSIHTPSGLRAWRKKNVDESGAGTQIKGFGRVAARCRVRGQGAVLLTFLSVPPGVLSQGKCSTVAIVSFKPWRKSRKEPLYVGISRKQARLVFGVKRQIMLINSRGATAREESARAAGRAA